MTPYTKKQEQEFTAILSTFDREIAGLVVRYAQKGKGNLWEDDIRMEARLALFNCLSAGKITPDPVTGLLDDAARRIAYVTMHHAVHVRVLPLGRNLSVSTSSLDKYRKLDRKLKSLGADANTLGVKEIAGLLGVSVEIARNLITLRQGCTSLNAKVGKEDGSSTVLDYVEDESTENPVDNLIRKDRQAVVRRMLDTVPPHGRNLLMRRFGLGSGDETSCAELAAERGCTRQSVDEQCRRMLKNLRTTYARNEFALAA